MGDAGPRTPDVVSQLHESAQEPQQREVTVLVTGFGPFKSFTTNPSHLIASRLPTHLPPLKSSSSSSTTTGRPPLTIRLIHHPHPIVVAYAQPPTLIPTLLAHHDPDYIFHMGMAGGREFYTLETVGQREGYVIKDVEGQDGRAWEWTAANADVRVGETKHSTKPAPELLLPPEELRVGWDEVDVLLRWRDGVRRFDADGVEVLDDKATVRLSRDAGRFLCDFILFESLGRRWVDARRAELLEEEVGEQQQDKLMEDDHGCHAAVKSGGAYQQQIEKARDREGKVAFFHCPGSVLPEDIERGVHVAEAAIRAFVESWEEGFRNVGVVAAGEGSISRRERRFVA